jgi:hypothetical protein
MAASEGSAVNTKRLIAALACVAALSSPASGADPRLIKIVVFGVEVLFVVRPVFVPL